MSHLSCAGLVAGRGGEGGSLPSRTDVTDDELLLSSAFQTTESGSRCGAAAHTSMCLISIQVCGGSRSGATQQEVPRFDSRILLFCVASA